MAAGRDVGFGATAEVLLDGVVDYAGLFPPASLPLAEAARRYDEYRRGEHGWMLGRFVLPTAGLDEIGRHANARGTGEPWRLSVLAGADDLGSVTRFVQLRGTGAVVDAIETKAATVVEVMAFPAEEVPFAAAGDRLALYVEVPVAADPTSLVLAAKSRGLRVKVRTGGVTADAFPTSAQLARFLSACCAHDVKFKATAGLHHPVSGDYPLTYEADSARAPMFGFLNVFLATSFLGGGIPELEAVELLEERDPRAFVFSADAIAWRGHVVTARSVRALRQHLAWSFGSCSFSEPVAALTSLELL